MDWEKFKKNFITKSEHAFDYLNGIDRVSVVFLFFILFAFAIFSSSFKYTVIDHDYYKKMAEKQQITEIKNPVTRGTIYSNNTPPGVFSTSTNLSDLAIDPQQEGDKQKLEDFLTDVVFEQLCKDKDEETCENGLSTFVKKYELEDFVYEEAYVKNSIRQEVKNKLNKKFRDSIILKENLESAQMQEIQAMNLEGIYFITNNLYADPTKVTDKQKTVSILAPKLNIKEDELDKKLKLVDLQYVSILKKLDLDLKDRIDKRVESESTAVKNKLLDIKNSIYRFLILESQPTRFYPENKLAAQITGFVTNDNEGKYGIEGYFNDQLKGEEGVKITKKDVSGRIIGGTNLGEKDSINGADLKLTIDRNVQKELTKILQDGIKEYRANKGSAIVMDPKTGAIIAMADSYEYDPNNYGDVYDLEKVSYAKYPNPGYDLLGMPVFIEDSASGTIYKLKGQEIKLRSATEKELANSAIPKYKFKNNFGPGAYNNDSIGSLYEPGSVFKAVTVAIGLDTGDIKPSDMYRDKGYVEIDNYKISNVANECMGYNTYLHALNWSCNVGMIDIIRKIGKPLFYKYINDFGFGQKTNISLEGEVYSQIPPYEKWSQAKLFTMSFGQGITATLIQMASAYSAIANGGLYMQPYIVDTMKLPNGMTIKNDPKPLRRVIKEETSKTIVAMLVEGVRHGFAKKGGVDGYDVAGKTGTSQIASKGGYEVGSAGHTITSYGGFAPAGNPKFVIIVRIDRPRSAVYSETTSSIMFQRIASYLLNYYGIPKNN
ncbi:MAG: penicillin-binding protein 2 [Candidatus Gracilibacteria bacterium]|nr:penicillin-binding protein 2 [Candidatus Gracilibacteria bacterium]